MFRTILILAKYMALIALPIFGLFVALLGAGTIWIVITEDNDWLAAALGFIITLFILQLGREIFRWLLRVRVPAKSSISQRDEKEWPALLLPLQRFLQRLSFQFSAIAIQFSLGSFLMLTVVIFIAYLLPLLAMFGVAKILGAQHALAWALFLNFILIVVIVAINLFVGTKQKIPLYDLYVQISENVLTQGTLLGKKLVSEALIRNFAVVYLIVIFLVTVTTASASAWSLAVLFSIEVVTDAEHAYMRYFSYFLNVAFQFMTAEAPQLFGISISNEQMNAEAPLAKFYVIFAKTVLLGAFLEIFVAASNELRRIYEDVDAAIGRGSRNASMQPNSIPFFRSSSSKFGIKTEISFRPNLVRPFTLSITDISLAK